MLATHLSVMAFPKAMPQCPLERMAKPCLGAHFESLVPPSLKEHLKPF